MSAPRACYADTRLGCQDVSWSLVESAIEAAFAAKATYRGYNKAQATAYAKTLYDHGIPAEVGLTAFKPQGAGRTSRVLVSVRDETGSPVRGLAAERFTTTAKGGTAAPATRALRAGDSKSEDIQLRAAAVVDDSGSISDCDAQFVADGLGAVFDVLPQVYQAELVKFATGVELHQPMTCDGALLAKAARTTCTDRGLTSLWDGVYRGVEDVKAGAHDGETPFVVVFSDGFDNDSARRFDDAVAAAKSQNIPVFVVGIGLADPFALTDLARATGGAFAYVPRAARIVDAFHMIGSMMSEAYVVDLPSEGEDPRTITVTLDSGKALVVDVPR